MKNVASARLFCILVLAVLGASTDSSPASENQGAIQSRVDLFGDALPAGALLRLGTVRLRHNARVQGVAFSPDGKKLASTSWDNSIHLWDRRTGKPLLEIINEPEGIFSVVFSPDGKQLATGGRDGTLTLWDVETGKLVFKKKGHDDRVTALAFSPDGLQIASAGGNICVWNSKTGAEIRNLPSPLRFGPGDSQGVAFSPDGKLLAGSYREQIHVWDVTRGNTKVVIPKAHLPIVTSLVFSDDKNLISGGHSTVCTWDVATGKQVRELKAGNGHGGSLALSGGGKILSAAYWNKIRVWNNHTGESMRVIADYRNAFGPHAHNLAITRDGATLAAAAEDHVVRVWDIVTGKQALVFPESHTGRINTLASSPDAKYVLTAADRSIRLWDATNGKHVRSFAFESANQIGGMVAAYSPDGKTIAAGCYDDSPKNRFAGACRVWDAATGKELRKQGFPNRVTKLAFSSDGKTLALVTEEDKATIFVWDLGADKEPVSLTSDLRDVDWLSFLPDGKTLAVIELGQLHFWDVEAKKQKANAILAGAALNSAAFSVDGKIVVIGEAHGGELVVRDVATGSELRRFEAVNTLGSMVALSLDGRILASAPIPRTFVNYKFDPSIRLWEMATGREIRKIHPGNSKVTTLTFSPGTRTLISGMQNGTALIWNVKPTNTKAISPRELGTLWSDLAGADAGKAYDAIGALAAAPGTSVPFLMDRLKPSPELPAARIRALIADLDSGEFRVREAAYKELEKLEEKATGMLREALAKNPVVEVRRRIESLIAVARTVRSPETVRRLRAIQVLEDIGSDDARHIIETLATGFPHARETADALATLKRLGQTR
jgi:WD40 repeat protein